MNAAFRAKPPGLLSRFEAQGKETQALITARLSKASGSSGLEYGFALHKNKCCLWGVGCLVQKKDLPNTVSRAHMKN